MDPSRERLLADTVTVAAARLSLATAGAEADVRPVLDVLVLLVLVLIGLLVGG